ncbi:PTS system lactose/cellobiose specific transporter subunit IIB [Brochothrix campestris FSL F6-1037]|uniref:PTS system lactose/cellobiose specific transporter subunit IIB n=2 Tax=Brochothrix campestris TaxID=2757 RepID=W7CUB3_9LIST|nr:PTS sugar transporter subunit IIB [Brochothrix campestris]EUJ39411.1 PTS system lactose/cellobiose specific transporter subunit IIB [Brochothrix campestris FSL F6-1037]
MPDKTIMLACAAGMSTSLLVTKMEEAAKARGLDAKIYAVSVSEVPAQLEKERLDIILLGPQVRYTEKQVAQQIGDRDVKLAVIEMRDYGMMNGEAVLATALDKLS